MFPLEYNTLFSEQYCGMFVRDDSLAKYLISYKLPEDLVITPTISQQYFTAGAKNRYIRSVTVNATASPTTTG